MNRQHLQTILWLRWRMSLNQLRRSGIASKIILALLAIMALGTAVTLFVVALLVGIFAFPQASAEVVMYVWDVVVLAFLMFWMVGLLVELQRAEVLSLEKLLHLPISLAGTFLINYVGSLLSLTLVVFLPGMIGLSIALVVAKGPAMLMLFPLLVGFLLMVTAISYQFQGWLAALMVNKRRRRTVIALVTLLFVLVFQLPNLLNAAFSGRGSRTDESAVRLREDLERLARAQASGEIDAEEFARQSEALTSAHQARVEDRNRQRFERFEQIAKRVNLFVPLGWLPFGAMACAGGNIFPAMLGSVGAGLIGAASLWRAYRTTLRLYTGQFTTGKRRSEPVPAAVKTVPSDAGLLERRLPGLSEHASAIAMANFRSLTRAPEAKMLLIGPAVMVIVFGSMLLMRRLEPPEIARPFMGLGAVAMIMFSVLQLLGNQFGLDRDGFRALVLSASPRRDILLGKNLSVAPLALCLGIVAVGILQAVYPMRVDHFLATLAELALTYLIFCLVGNFTSILAPMPVASGSLRPAHPKGTAILVQLLHMFFLLPLVSALALAPLGLELLLNYLGWFKVLPIYLLFSLVELVIVAGVYYAAIGWQGRLLHAREQKILAVVTTKVE